MLNFNTKNILLSAVLLSTFAIIGTGIVLTVFESTSERISQSEKNYLIAQLHGIIKPDEHDNDLLNDTLEITDSLYLKTNKPVIAYRARKLDKPVAILFTVNAPDGYNGLIKILIGIYADGELAGVRIISHRETPGLGDDIDENKSDWIYRFTNKSLNNTSKQQWAVKKDGGSFDQFTGATITPRAVIKAVNNALMYYAKNKEQLFSIKPQNQQQEKNQ